MVLWILLASASGVDAQAALAATSVTRGLPPNARLTLRPGPGFEQLAVKVARVLTLRGVATVEVGEPPPSDELAGVEAGHVALAPSQPAGSARLILGAALGDAYEAVIMLSPDGEGDARVLALAIEALRDRAIEVRARNEARMANELGPDQSGEAAAATTENERALGEALPADPAAAQVALPPAQQPAVSPAVPSTPVEVVAQPRTEQPDRSAVNPYQLIGDPRDEGELAPLPERAERTLKVKPRLYFSVYGGASAESRAFRTGVGTGGGLCVRGQCLLLGLEYPMPFNLEQGADDVRYRYPTFSCTFHSQPFSFGRFAPAVSVSVLSRVGHFERDMGLKDYLPGLDTDLGVRGTVEGAFEVVEAVDIVAQAGIDYALDRWQYGETSRGSRTAPWLQAGIRVRPE